MALNIGKGAQPKQQPQAESKIHPNGFLKKGAAAAKLFEKEEAAVEVAKEQQGKLWRFRIPGNQLGEDFRITFLDGDLSEDGTIDAFVWKEHTLQWNGRWENFVAIGDNEPDPIEESGSKPVVKFALTVIDHTPYTSKDGKVFKDRRRLFVGTRKTYNILSKIAVKRGGLAGATFSVCRHSDKSPACGEMFEFEEKHKLADLKAQYGDQAEVANYGEEIVYRDRATLLKMGFGSGISVGGEKPTKDLDKEL